MSPDTLACLHALRQKVLWLSTWMIHHANHVRVNRDGLKVGGHHDGTKAPQNRLFSEAEVFR